MTSRAAELRTKLQTICFSGGEIEQKKVAVVTKKLNKNKHKFQEFFRSLRIPGFSLGGSNFQEFSRSVRTLNIMTSWTIYRKPIDPDGLQHTLLYMLLDFLNRQSLKIVLKTIQADLMTVSVCHWSTT